MLPLRETPPAGSGTPKKKRCGAPLAGLMRSSKSARFTGVFQGFATCATNTTAGCVSGSAGSKVTMCSPAPLMVQGGSE